MSFKIPDWIRQLVEVLSPTLDHSVPVEWVVGRNKEGDLRVLLHPAVIQTRSGLKTSHIRPRNLPETLGVFDFGSSVTHNDKDGVTISGKFAGNPILVDILSEPPDFATPSFTLKGGKLIPIHGNRPRPPLN